MRPLENYTPRIRQCGGNNSYYSNLEIISPEFEYSELVCFDIEKRIKQYKALEKRSRKPWIEYKKVDQRSKALRNKIYKLDETDLIRAVLTKVKGLCIPSYLVVTESAPAWTIDQREPGFIAQAAFRNFLCALDRDGHIKLKGEQSENDNPEYLSLAYMLGGGKPS
jgi:hypothetical protein